MTLKNKSVKKEEPNIADLLAQVGAGSIDSAEATVDNTTVPNLSASVPVDTQNDLTLNNVQSLIDAVKSQINQPDPNAMSAIDPDEYNKVQPGVTVTPSSDKKAYQGPVTPRQREEIIERLNAGQATDADLERIDESMVMDLPFIKASNYSIPGQYNPKPKDPAIRFRWVNCVNALQSNMQRFLALGFVLATPDDVDQVRTPLGASMIDGTQIKQYDVVLMKINVMQLMALYKKNVLDSLYKLDMATNGRTAIAAAQQTFHDLVDSDPMARSGLNKTRVASGREPVTFNHT